MKTLRKAGAKSETELVTSHSYITVIIIFIIVTSIFALLILRTFHCISKLQDIVPK
jgi:hypothetical protein